MGVTDQVIRLGSVLQLIAFPADRGGVSKTPPLPDWIRHARVPGYVTAHELCPDETRLFGTESWYGDWSGRVLLLAKDFAPSSYLEGRIARREARPYSHDCTRRTNKLLRKWTDPRAHLGLLYGSALANLLRTDGKWSGPLPNRSSAIKYGTRVLEFVIEHMPALQRIICLGEESWECANAAEGLSGKWQQYRDSGTRLGRLVAAFHPAARVSAARIATAWRALDLD